MALISSCKYYRNGIKGLLHISLYGGGSTIYASVCTDNPVAGYLQWQLYSGTQLLLIDSCIKLG